MYIRGFSLSFLARGGEGGHFFFSSYLADFSTGSENSISSGEPFSFLGGGLSPLASLVYTPMIVRYIAKKMAILSTVIREKYYLKPVITCSTELIFEKVWWFLSACN